jgi:hypothetical protein
MFLQSICQTSAMCHIPGEHTMRKGQDLYSLRYIAKTIKSRLFYDVMGTTVYLIECVDQIQMAQDRFEISKLYTDGN